MKVCFIGHREVKKTEELMQLLKETTEILINKGVTAFLFGSMSDFNKYAWEAVTSLKEKYHFIKRVYVRSGWQYIDKTYEEYLLGFYEETYFPQKIEKAGKYSYVERNYEMIDESAYCVFYYDKNYLPHQSGKAQNGTLPKSRKSGTKIAYEYATRKQKQILNLCK